MKLVDVGFDAPPIIMEGNLDPYGYDPRDVSVIHGIPFHASGELKATWHFDTIFGHKFEGEK